MQKEMHIYLHKDRYGVDKHGHCSNILVCLSFMQEIISGESSNLIISLIIRGKKRGLNTLKAYSIRDRDTKERGPAVIYKPVSNLLKLHARQGSPMREDIK